MERIKSAISYLRGLMEGVELDCDRKESKVLFAMADVLDVLAQEVEHLGAQGQYCEEMIDDILDGSVADNFGLDDAFDGNELDDYANDDLEDYQNDDQDYNAENKEEYDYRDEDFVEVECPHCHQLVDFEKQTYENSKNLICPNCVQLIERDKA